MNSLAHEVEIYSPNWRTYRLTDTTKNITNRSIPAPSEQHLMVYSYLRQCGKYVKNTI